MSCKLLSAVVLVSILGVPAAAVQAVDRSSANSVWVAETGGAIRLSSSDGSIEVEISGLTGVRAAGLDLRRETVWLLAGGELAAFDLSGAPRFSLPVAVPGSVHAALVVVPATGAVWLGAHRDLLHVGAGGQLLGAFELAATTVALAVDEEASLLWVGTDRLAEARDLVTGAPVGTIPVELPRRLGDLRVAPESGRLWIAAGDQARLYERTGELLLATEFPGLLRIAPAPGGEAWVASAKAVARLDAGGEAGPAFEPLAGRGTIEHLVASGDGSVWAASQTTVARLPGDGSPAERISFEPPARIRDLATNTDWIAPTLELLEPAAGACLADATPAIELGFADRGWGADPETLQLYADGAPIASACTTAAESATCQVLDPLADGERLLGATIADYAGNESETAAVAVVIDTVAPAVQLDSPADGSVLAQPEVTFQGSLSEPASLTLDGAPVTLDADLRFHHGPVALEPGENRFELVAVDCAGNEGRLTVSVIHQPPPAEGLPPDPATVAPPVDPTLPAEIHEATRFLYEGATPIQFEVEAGAIDPSTVAVLRGRVISAEGDPLAGVRVAIHRHAGYGHTLTRQDGMFDLAVNGGGMLTIEYSKAGYLPAHRQVVAPWRDFALAEDVILLAYDQHATPVSMGSAVVQVARGSASADDDGTRRATVIVPAGTAAELVFADGSSLAVPALTVRATEYTVGAGGLQAMPAPLPPTSGYTYAVELSADEAVAAGATTVTFSQPVLHYVENFLDFPVGGIVPAGYYDRERAGWIPSDNGRVIQVLDVVAGRAVLDLDGSGHAATEAELEAFAITEGERARLGDLYEPGQSLWRTPIPHFTPWDCNWPAGPPEDAEEPPDPDNDRPDSEEDDEHDPEEPTEVQDDDAPGEEIDDPSCETGSLIECENQVLGEVLPLVGTSQSLHYRSNRVPGHRVADILTVRLSGRSVPASLKRIELRIDIAGRRFHRTFAAAPNQTFSFVWDRQDAYGRTLQGRQPATVHVGYVYNLVYYEPAQSVSSFAAISPRTQILGNRAGLEVTLWRSATKRIGASDRTADGVGGWTLSEHHVYDPATREIHYGSGAKQLGAELRSLDTFEPSRVTAPLIGPLSFTVGHDGSVYFTHEWHQGGFAAAIHSVWKITPDGRRQPSSLYSEASNTPGMSIKVAPDGDLYVATCFSSSMVVHRRIQNLSTGELWGANTSNICYQGLTFAPDGSIYHRHQRRIVHEWPDGTSDIVFTVPFGQSLGLPVLDQHGRIYVSRPNAHQVWRIDPDGSSQVVAGSGIRGFAGDGSLATEAHLDEPSSLAIAPDGSLLIRDIGNHRIRRVDPSGIIHTFAGSGLNTVTTGPSAPLAAGLSGGADMAVGPDGTVFLSRPPGNRGALRRITNPLSGYTGLGEITLVSESGNEVFVFDHRGRHLRTLNAVTGAVDRTFGYDSDGRLTSIADAFGNVTRIERDAFGAATAIIAPLGQRTELELDEDGFLASATNPAGESHQLRYRDGGLLRSLTDPAGHEKTYQYSPLGRLVLVQDAAGGTKRLRRWVSGPGRHRVEVITAEGRTTSYSVRRRSDGSRARSTATADGTTARTAEAADGSRVVALPSGAEVRTIEGADPRFGMQSPVPASAEVSTPSGLTRRTTMSHEATLTSPGDPFSVSTLRTTVTVNGREGFRLFDSASAEVVTASPMGRTAVQRVDERFRPLELRLPGTEELRYEYDSRGRMSRVSQGQGEEERALALAFDGRGRLASVVDPLLREVRFDYDDADRVIRQTLPGGRAVELQYDANGNVTAVIPPGRPPHLFRYTPVDAVEAYEPPELDFGSPATTYSYDRDRRLVEVVRPDGKAVNVTYDAAGRPEAISHPAGEVGLGYDPETGQLASIGTPESAISYSYDGFLLTGTAWSGEVEGTVGRAYDESFWLRARTVNGQAVTFDYDADGLLTRAGELAISRDLANGRVLGTALGSVETSVSYDPFGDLEKMAATAGEAELYAVAFERDRLGRIAAKTESVGGLTHRLDYRYDLAGRLDRVERDGAPVEEYLYDENGNRLSATYPWGERHGVYDDQDRLLAYGDATFTYTEAGDLVSRTEAGATTTFDYDVFGNLRRVALPSGDVVDYVIDARNRRVGRKVNGVLVQGFLYQDALNPVAELDGSGAVVARFVYGSRSHVPDSMVKAGTTYRLLSDHLGSVRLVVDATTGAIAQRLDYDAFGRAVLDTNPGFQPFGFAGGIYDAFTGLVRFGARDYDPQIGRWATKDPIGFAGGDANTYTYALANPITYIDPRGLAVQVCQRPNEIAQYENIPILRNLPHLWIKTSEKQAGLGEAGGGIPGSELPDAIYPDTEIVDHTDEFEKEGVACTDVPLVDEDCVNERLDIGKSRGKWFPFVNDCWAFVDQVIGDCRRNPGRPGYRQSPL